MAPGQRGGEASPFWDSAAGWMLIWIRTLNASTDEFADA